MKRAPIRLSVYPFAEGIRCHVSPIHFHPLTVSPRPNHHFLENAGLLMNHFHAATVRLGS
jgi:hypothetical protein